MDVDIDAGSGIIIAGRIASSDLATITAGTDIVITGIVEAAFDVETVEAAGTVELTATTGSVTQDAEGSIIVADVLSINSQSDVVVNPIVDEISVVVEPRRSGQQADPHSLVPGCSRVGIRVEEDVPVVEGCDELHVFRSQQTVPEHVT